MDSENGNAQNDGQGAEPAANTIGMGDGFRLQVIRLLTECPPEAVCMVFDAGPLENGQPENNLYPRMIALRHSFLKETAPYHALSLAGEHLRLDWGVPACSLCQAFPGNRLFYTPRPSGRPVLEGWSFGFSTLSAETLIRNVRCFKAFLAGPDKSQTCTYTSEL